MFLDEITHIINKAMSGLIVRLLGGSRLCTNLASASTLVSLKRQGKELKVREFLFLHISVKKEDRIRFAFDLIKGEPQ